jgi:threonine dehydrogenase-like Zn-dependent dehydrogenase
LDATRRRGRCVLNGLPSTPLELDIAELVFGEKHVVGSLASAWQFERTMDLIASGRVKPQLMFGATYAFADVPAALEAAHTRRDLGKIVIDHR